MADTLNIVIIGLSITSSWGNGHATTYRGLVREMVNRGHNVLFLENDVPWYADNRDLPKPPYGTTELYKDVEDLKDRFAADVRNADCVIVGSYVVDGVAVGEWVTAEARGITAFYDIDTPVTLAKLRRGDHEYLSPELVREYDMYLSFTGGPTLTQIERQLRARAARPLYCSVDPAIYYPETIDTRWELGYMGTYSDDRQPTVDAFLIEPAREEREMRFAAAGPKFPSSIDWPPNVERIEHLAPAEHRSFYNSQRFTLNVTRADMIRAGYSPSVRLFEAAACGVPVISDHWTGLSEFFKYDEEILVARSTKDVLRFLRETVEEERRKIGERAMARVLKEHTAARRAEELEGYILETAARPRRSRSTPASAVVA
jgi:spore maturation protein CgeB